MNNLIILAIPVKWPDDGAVDFCTLFLQQENATTCFRQECEGSLKWEVRWNGISSSYLNRQILL